MKDTLQKPVDIFESVTADMRATRYPKPYQMAQIGDVMICRYPNTYSDGTLDGTYKNRPVVIWGVYHNQYDEIVGFDVLTLTTSFTIGKINLSDILLQPNEFLGNKDDKMVVLDASAYTTLPIELFDTKMGVTQSIQPNIIADIISSRANALNANPSHRYINAFDVDDELTREGIYFKDELVQPIKSSHSPDLARPDVEMRPYSLPNRKKTDENKNVLIDKSDIDAITRWSVAYIKLLIGKRAVTSWPAKGTWPNWPDVQYKGQVIQCCSKAKATVRDYQPDGAPKSLTDARPRP